MRTAQLIDADFAGHSRAAGEAAPEGRASATVSLLPVSVAPDAHGVQTPAPPARRSRGWLQHRLASWLLAAVSIASVLLVWHLATLYRLDFYVRFNNIPTPAQVFDKIIEVNRSAKFITSIGISVRRILFGFAVATVLGVALGLFIGRYRLVRQLVMPAMEVFRPIPAIAWVPMSIMLWPSNEVSIVFITFLLSLIHI